MLRKITSKSRMAMVGATLSVVGLTGCASVGTVSESERDVSGRYDGVWMVEIQKAAGLQYVQGWNMNCGDMRDSIPMLVKDGMMQFDDSPNALKVGVAESGRFKMVIPLGDIASASPTSDISIANGDVKIILRGNLSDEKSKGHITYGIAEMGYGGCTAKTKFRRLERSESI